MLQARVWKLFCVHEASRALNLKAYVASERLRIRVVSGGSTEV